MGFADIAFPPFREHPALGTVVNSFDNAFLNLTWPLCFIKTLFRAKHDDLVKILIARYIERLGEF